MRNPFGNPALCRIQDDANKMGGKWIIRLRKGLASRCWENLILAMLGEQFMVGEEICGAVVSVRFQVNIQTRSCVTWSCSASVCIPSKHALSASLLQEDIISIWNKTASDQATTARIRDTLRRVLNLPPNTIMEYKTHTDSIKYVCLIVLLFSLQPLFLSSLSHKYRNVCMLTNLTFSHPGGSVWLLKCEDLQLLSVLI